MLLASVRDGCGLQVRFTRPEDRYAHQISVCWEGLVVPILASVEGDDEDRWPDSPALQQIQLEERPQGPVALLVGMAGTSHWSVGIEAEPSNRQMVFDIACRAREVPLRLGSAYRTLIPWIGGGPKSSLHCLASGAEGPLVCELVPMDTTSADLRGSELRLHAEIPLHLPATVRWRYRIAVRREADNAEPTDLQP